MVPLNECQKGQAAPNRGKKYLAELLSQDGVNVLISGCSNQAPTGIRNRALMAVMYRAACLLGRLWQSRPKNIDSKATTATLAPCRPTSNGCHRRS